ncbi:SH3 domain-containing protein [Alishewanella sp. HL-SH05]|uniref:SH3 domain-containing protein n=1 Tax=Alishewanella sp. HL-SH05 TaxID=3461145 RepID=UPI004041570E
MRFLTLMGCGLFCSLLLALLPLQAQQVVVQQDFVELHTGPGRGYPIVQVVLKGDALTLLKQRGGWIRVQYRQQTLWLASAALAHLYLPEGEQSLASLWQVDQPPSAWQLGLAAGDFAGTSYYQLSASYDFSDVIFIELSAGQGSGQQASSQQFLVQLGVSPWPHWRWSPYFALGGGVLLTQPRTILVQTPERNSPMANMELGLDYALTRRLQANLRYRRGLISTERDINEETNTWLIGLKLAF